VDNQEVIQVEGLIKIFGRNKSRALEMLKKGIQKDDILKKTGATVGLNNVSFSVKRGEILVIMGLSGSGKSTLIRCINHLIEPTAGKILIDGSDTTYLSSQQLLDLRRHKVTMVFQNYALLPHYTVRQNVEYGLEIQGMCPDERVMHSEKYLQLVGLHKYQDQYPHQLSGGMQQRVGIARALAVDSEILLMDEAFSALDPMTRRDMQLELIAIQEEVKNTILFVTHDLDEATRLGDHILLLRGGEVVQFGSPEEILTNPATPYVERFVEDVDKSKYLTAENALSRHMVVAYYNDGPSTVLKKMSEENLTDIFVVSRNFQLLGSISVDEVERLKKLKINNIHDSIDKDIMIVKHNEPLSNLLEPLSKVKVVPVVNESDKLLGLISKSGLLATLSDLQTPGDE